MTETAQSFIGWERVLAVTTPRLRAQCRLLEHFGIHSLEFLDRHYDGEILAILERIDFGKIRAAGFLALLWDKPLAVDGILVIIVAWISHTEVPHEKAL